MALPFVENVIRKLRCKIIFIGIDPGKQGGISAMSVDISKIYTFWISPMPKTEADICAELKSYELKAKAIIEAVHAFPGQGVTSMFTFGQGYGFLRGCLVSLEIPFTEVTPQKWMGYFGLKKQKNETSKQFKLKILQKAQNLFPDVGVALQTADSLMLAEYLRLTDRS